MPLRLYKIYSETGKCTGAKRDYPSEQHFIKYGRDTYEGYNWSHYYSGEPTGTKAKLCFLNAENKWEQVSEDKLKELLG